MQPKEQEFPSQIFVPFRALGIVTNEVPFHFFSVKTKDFVALSTGKSYQVLDCEHLRLSRVGPAYTRKIRALCSYERFILFAAGADIVVSLQSDIVKVLKGHHGRVYKLLVIGIFLLSIGEDNVLIIWNLQQMAEQGRIPLHHDHDHDFRATALMHPDTYLNKVLVGDARGNMAIYNLRSKKLVYQFQSFGASITCIAQSPVVDVVGVGLADGRIIVHNLKLDKTVFTFTQTEGAVTTMAFRTDKQPLLCTGTPHGQVVLWDLTKRRLLNVFNAHTNGPVVHTAFLHDEPVLITTGADNSIKMWMFDMGAQDTGRLLRARLGHPTPPKMVRWFGGSFVVTASGNCLRSQKVMADSGTREFGVASQMKKLHLRSTPLSHIIDFSMNPIKQREWDDVITCHENSITAHTWSTLRGTLGAHALKSTENNPTPIKSVALSACGNFGYIGTASGWIDKFNMQSGIHRGSCTGALHAAAVVSMCCDGANRYVISASLDGFVKVWNMNLELEFSIDLSSPVSKLALSPHSQLLAIACDDLIIRLYDVDAKRTVRKFVGHDNLITDIAFSSDERWLITSSSDNTVRVWDIPTGKMIDWFALKKTVSSLSFSPTGDFLATTHVNERSVSVWSNKAYFSGLMLKAVPKVAPSIGMPTIRKPTNADENDDDKDEEEALEIKQEQENDTVATRSSEPIKRKREGADLEAEDVVDVKQEEIAHSQLDKSLVTLSSLPKSRWITLADIDLIKERNKGSAKAVVPDTPFFIPTIAGLKPSFDASASASVDPKLQGSRILSMSMDKPQTKFMQLVASKDYDGAMDFLSSLSPSGIDFELHAIPSSSSNEWFVLVLKFFSYQLKTNARFELVQAYINRFLKVHSDILMRPELSTAIGKLLQAHKAGWNRLEAIFHSNLCLVNYFSSLHT